MNDKILKIIETVTVIICAVFIGWLFFSWIDVISHNLGDCHYQAWNFFTLFAENFA